MSRMDIDERIKLNVRFAFPPPYNQWQCIQYMKECPWGFEDLS